MRDDPEFLRVAIGMIAHVLNELVASVEAINVNIADVRDEELRADLMNGLDELSALAASIAKEFRAPSQNGWPPPA